MKKLILTLLFGLLAVPALQAAELPEDELKVQVLSSISSEPRECYICHQPLTNPITLPCGHDDKFDAMCLLTYAVTRARQRIPGEERERLPIACPLCAEILVPEEEPEQQGEVLLAGEDFEEQEQQENPEMAEILRQRRVEALDAEAQIQIEQMDEQEARDRQVALQQQEARDAQLDAENFDDYLAMGVCCAGVCIGSLALASRRFNEPATGFFGVVGLMASGIAGLELHQAYASPLPAREKLQRTNAFIKRNKTKIGTLAALASLGLLGKKVLSARK